MVRAKKHTQLKLSFLKNLARQLPPKEPDLLKLQWEKLCDLANEEMKVEGSYVENSDGSFTPSFSKAVTLFAKQFINLAARTFESNRGATKAKRVGRR